MDCHGAGKGWTFNSLLPEALDPRCEWVVQNEWTEYTGFLEEGCDAALFIGMHARAGVADGVLNHTISGSDIYELRFNGTPVGETGINAALCGTFDCPVLLVTGDDAVCRESRELLGDGLTTVAVKQGLGRQSARNIAPQRARALIENGAKQALADLTAVAPYDPGRPSEIEVLLMGSHISEPYLAAVLADASVRLVVEEPELENVARVETVDPEQVSRCFDGSAGRHEAHQLAAHDLGAAGLSLGGDRGHDRVERGSLPVRDVHAHLHEPGLRQVEPQGAYTGEAAVALADEGGDLTRNLDGRAVEVHVERDERPADPDQHSTRRRMELHRPAIGGELACIDPPLELLGAAAPKECRLAPVVRQSPVEEDGETELAPHPLGECHGGLAGGRLVLGPQRHEWDDIRGPDPGMRAPVPGEVGEQRLHQLVFGAHDREHRAVVVPVGVDVEQPARR
jgi:hypothetical protein